MNKSRLVYIAGAGRSGSTVLAKEISTLVGGENIGEYFLMLSRQYMFDSVLPCSCGKHARECERYRNIFQQAEVALQIPFIDKDTRIRRSLLSCNDKGTDYFNRLFEYLDIVLGSDAVVVDSSKTPGVLKYLVEKELLVIHLLRDPMDTIKSWSSTKGYLDKKGFFPSLHDWVFSNYLTLFFCKLHRVNYIRIKLEDLDRDGLIRALRKFGFEIDIEARASESHILAGNPDKFSSGGSVSIKNARTSTFELSFFQKLLVRLVSWPLGY